MNYPKEASRIRAAVAAKPLTVNELHGMFGHTTGATRYMGAHALRYALNVAKTVRLEQGRDGIFRIRPR